MRLSFAAQYGKPCVVVETADVDADLVVRTALAHGATSDADGELALVIDFYDSDARRVGPELYSREALARTFARKVRA